MEPKRIVLKFKPTKGAPFWGPGAVSGLLYILGMFVMGTAISLLLR